MASRILDIPYSASPEELEETAGHSLASTSAASFLTAPPATSSPHSRSASSSTHTLGVRDPEPINPLHAIAFPTGKRSPSTHSLPQELHIVQVTDDRVQIRSGPVPEPLFAKVGPSIVRTVPDCLSDGASAISDGAGPPPPSPPASTEHDQEFIDEVSLNHSPLLDADPNSTTASPRIPYVVPLPNGNGRPVTFGDPATVASGSSLRQHTKSPSRPSHSQSLSHRSSAETKASFTAGKQHRISRTLTNQSDSGVDVEEDGLLHAPQPKHVRRNTIAGTPPLPSPSSGRSAGPHGVAAHSLQGSEVDGDLGELATDIQQQAEQIRRERQSKRAKAAEVERAKHDAEKALTRTASLVRAFSKDDKPLVGNLIGEGHVNYVLMYNMLTGIRIAVSRWQAKIMRDLTPEDFSAAHKYSFDMYVP